jgi:XTP/dITP diphosphohydrolase
MSKNVSNTDKLKRKLVFFATGNTNKFNEARCTLEAYGVTVGMLRLKGDEIQSESLQEIAEKSVLNAYRNSHLPIFVEDAGLFIDALEGFPGPYAAYVYKTIHNMGILKLMKHEKNRKAHFQSIISYCDAQNATKPISFYGESKGEITQTERKEPGKLGFGFDPIFQPISTDKTFAQMTIKEKNHYSHRANAIRKFAEWFIMQH